MANATRPPRAPRTQKFEIDMQTTAPAAGTQIANVLTIISGNRTADTVQTAKILLQAKQKARSGRRM